jgi:FkbH-like protein
MNKSFRDICREAETADELRDIVARRGPAALSSTEIALLNRAAERLAFPFGLRFAYAGTHSMDPLPACLRARAVGLGIGVTDFVAPYGQYMQQLLGEQTELSAFDPDVLFISCAMRQLAPRIHNAFETLSQDELIAERDRILAHVTEVAELAASRLGATVLVGNFPRPGQPALGVADAKRELGETEFYLTLNLELARRFRGSDRIHVVDLDRLVGGLRLDATEPMYFLAKTVWSPDQANHIAQELLRYVIAATGRTRKCLVVDLDNTLWGGVAGEDGPAGVRVGQGSPDAEAFESFQYAVRALRGRGIILAICSKNNPEDALAVFAARDQMPLKLEDFAAREISWDNKATGLLNLAATLNIGVDSLVFVDDNPAERAAVRAALPGVTVLKMPTDPADYASYLRAQPLFDKLRVSADDLARLADYGSQQVRERLRLETGNLEDYLQGLGTKVHVRPAQPADLARVHELFNKTNQFNLTTQRYSLAEVERFLADPGYLLGVASATDNFGAMGTIGVFLAEVQDGVARLDSFLMSCRALGRAIETAVMNCVKRELLENFDCRQMHARFIPTRKNAPAKDFLAAEGFQLEGTAEDGTESYRLGEAGFAPRPCAHLAVVHEFERNSETA